MPPGTVVGNHAEIIKLFHQGVSLSGIARLAGVATTQISQVLERAGLRQRQKMRPRDLEEERRIAAAYADGMSLEEIRDTFGWSDWKTRECVKRHGGKLRNRGQQTPRFSDEQIREMVSLYSSGLSQVDIGKKLGHHQTTVSRVLRGAGIVDRYRATGDRHGHWKGGRVRLPEGYIGIRVTPEDPMHVMANSTGYVPEHRLAMARKLGRPLTKRETVHHIDGDRANNAPENLQLRQGRHGKHECHQCADCGSRNIVAVPL